MFTLFLGQLFTGCTTFELLFVTEPAGWLLDLIDKEAEGKWSDRTDWMVRWKLIDCPVLEKPRFGIKNEDFQFSIHNTSWDKLSESFLGLTNILRAVVKILTTVIKIFANKQPISRFSSFVVPELSTATEGSIFSLFGSSACVLNEVALDPLSWGRVFSFLPSHLAPHFVRFCYILFNFFLLIVRFLFLWNLRLDLYRRIWVYLRIKKIINTLGWN